MSTGLNMQVMAAKETTYGTRAAPTRTFEVTDDAIGWDINYYVSQGLGAGLWRRRRVQTTQTGGGTLPQEVPTVGFGFFLDLLHNETVTGVQQGATTAYLQTHPLASAPAKSATIQIGRPSTDGTTRPFDYLGCMLSGIEFAWEPAGVLMATPTIVAREQQTNQTLATKTNPTSTGLFSFKGGSVTIGGSAVADIVGGGSVAVNWPLRDDAFPLGSSGLIKKPLPNDRPSMTGSFTADFTDLTHYNRVTGGTLADVVLLFEGNTISGAFKEKIQITVPDAGFNGPPPQVSGPGPLQQTVSFENASTTGDAPEIQYQSTDTAP